MIDKMLFDIQISSNKKTIEKLTKIIFSKFNICPIFVKPKKYYKRKYITKFVRINKDTKDKILKIIANYDKIYDTITLYYVEDSLTYWRLVDINEK